MRINADNKDSTNSESEEHSTYESIELKAKEVDPKSGLYV